MLYRIALETLLDSWNLARSLAQTRRQRPAGETPRIEQTREVWSHVAYWMHSEANREVGRERLHTKLVEVLVSECDKNDFEAQAIAGSYLDSAAETSGLLEARGANTFAFVHQSFQEYLAGYRLVRPASKALARVQEHCHDPRWHEVIRLGVGHLSITVGEKDVVAEIVEALLTDGDPLEPYLCTALRLALGCLADQVGLRRQQTDAIFCATASRLGGTERAELRNSLVEALKPIEAPPGPEAQAELLKLTSRDDWAVRMEAVRLTVLAPRLPPTTVERLQSLLASDQDPVVAAWAAFGLWRQGCKHNAAAKALAHGLQSSYARMPKPPSEDFRPALLKLLEHPDADVRLRAARVLGQWGPQEKAVPALLKLLEHPDVAVRFRAAHVLGQWEPQEKAAGTSLVVELLLRELNGQALPALLAAFQSTGQAKSGFASREVRHELACLLGAKAGEDVRLQTLRSILHRLVWQRCATTG